MKKILSLFVLFTMVLSLVTLPSYASEEPGTKAPFIVDSKSDYVNEILSPTGHDFNDNEDHYNTANSKINDFDVSITSGASGMSGDNALYLKAKAANVDHVFGIGSDYSTEGCRGFTENYVLLFSHSKMPEFYSGRTGNYVIEFDIKADTANAGFGINHVPFWSGIGSSPRYNQYYVMNPDGYWFNSSTTSYEAGKWYHLKMSLTKDGYWTATYYERANPTNVVSIVKDVKQSSSWATESKEYTHTGQNMFLHFNHPNSGDAGFAIDNFSVYQEFPAVEPEEPDTPPAAEETTTKRNLNVGEPSKSDYVNKYLSVEGNSFDDVNASYYNTDNSADFDMSFVSGRTGGTDKALYLKTAADKDGIVYGLKTDDCTNVANSFTKNSLKLYDFSRAADGYGTNRIGNYVIEFDVKADTTDAALGLRNVPFWEGIATSYRGAQYYVMDPNGHWFNNSETSYEKNKWYHLKMSLSKDGYWTVVYYSYDTPTQVITVVNNKAQLTDGWLHDSDSSNEKVGSDDGAHMFLLLSQPTANSLQGTAGFTIDNIKVYEEIESKIVIADFRADAGIATLNICNTTDEAVTGTLIIAAYTDGELTGLYYTHDVTAAIGNNVKTNLIVDAGTTYKAMFWKTDYTPYLKPVIYNTPTQQATE